MKEPASDREERLRRATVAAAKGDGSKDELEAAATALVLALKSEDAPPERMLLRIKDILAEAGLRPAYASTDSATPVRGEAAIYRSVIELSIRQYYADHRQDGAEKQDHDGRDSGK
jgi:hypothetical protein